MPLKSIATPVTRLAILASVLLNIGLLSALAFSRAEPGAGDAIDVPAAPGETSRSSGPEGYTGYQAYYQELLSHGLSHEETRAVLLAKLELEAREAAALPELSYWQPRDTSRFESPLRLSAELDHVRRVLTEVYGADAERDAAFSTVFRPLGPGFSFLTSAQQVEVHRLKLEQQISTVTARATPSPFAGQPPLVAGQPPAMAPPTSTQFMATLADVLEEEALFEYRLRDSPLAEQLRASEVEFTEAEFRETFEILSRLEEAGGTSELYASSRGALRTLLGSRRFALLWLSRDPLFAVIKQSCTKHSLAEDTVLTVYELFNDSQDRVAAIMQGAKSDPQRGGQQVREERAALQRRLSGLVGDDVAEDILSAQTQHMLSLARNQRLIPR